MKIIDIYPGEKARANTGKNFVKAWITNSREEAEKLKEDGVLFSIILVDKIDPLPIVTWSWENILCSHNTDIPNYFSQESRAYLALSGIKIQSIYIRTKDYEKDNKQLPKARK